MEKFGGVILLGLLTLVFIAFVPKIFEFIKWFFNGFLYLITKPVYWITGTEIQLSWWVGLIIFIIPILFIIFTGFRSSNRSSIMM